MTCKRRGKSMCHLPRYSDNNSTVHPFNIQRAWSRKLGFFRAAALFGHCVPAAIDIFLTFVNVAITWALCELVVVDRLIRRRSARSGGFHQGEGARSD